MRSVCAWRSSSERVDDWFGANVEVTSEWDFWQAVGTVVAALVAGWAVVYVEYIKPRLRQPRLKLEFDHRDEEQEDCEATVRNGTAVEQWLRVRVVNSAKRRRHRDAAQDAEVLFLARRRHRGDGEHERCPIEPRPLRWSATARSRQRNGVPLDLLTDADADPPQTRVTIPSRTWRFIDVIMATDNSSIEDAGQWKKPRVCTWPFHEDRHVLSPGTHELYFALTARNATTTYWRMIVTWTGKWPQPGESWWADHFSVIDLCEVETLPTGSRSADALPRGGLSPASRTIA